MSAKQVPGVDQPPVSAKRVTEPSEPRVHVAKLALSLRQLNTRKPNAYVAASVAVCS